MPELPLQLRLLGFLLRLLLLDSEELLAKRAAQGAMKSRLGLLGFWDK